MLGISRTLTSLKRQWWFLAASQPQGEPLPPSPALPEPPPQLLPAAGAAPDTWQSNRHRVPLLAGNEILITPCPKLSSDIFPFFSTMNFAALPEVAALCRELKEPLMQS